MSLRLRYQQAQAILQQADQSQVLHFYPQLDEAGQDKLLTQIQQIDWPQIARLVQSHMIEQPTFELPNTLEPAPYYPQAPTGDLLPLYQHAGQQGIALISQNKVAAFTVAGGQGTRLGWDGPKGSFPATPIKKLPLFACLAQAILKTQQKYDCQVPWYIMTSPANDAATREIFKTNDFFGLQEKNIMIFPQAMMPALDPVTGKALLAARDSLALSPDGHGGSLKALYTSGALADMTKRGVEQISYTQIDNPHVRVVDPLFIGLHSIDHAQMSSKMLPKTHPFEKLGVFCLANGKMSVIEYSDLPKHLAKQCDEAGKLRFGAGSIAIHVMRVDFVTQLNETKQGFALPFHRANKKVPYVCLEDGKLIEPDGPNAAKLETFVFDALPMCDHSIVYETDRVAEFAPIKNARGDDSAQTSCLLQTQRAAHWLESKGVSIARKSDGQVDAVIEISPLTAIEADDLDQVTLPEKVQAGSRLFL